MQNKWRKMQKGWQIKPSLIKHNTIMHLVQNKPTTKIAIILLALQAVHLSDALLSVNVHNPC